MPDSPSVSTLRLSGSKTPPNDDSTVDFQSGSESRVSQQQRSTRIFVGQPCHEHDSFGNRAMEIVEEEIVGRSDADPVISFEAALLACSGPDVPCAYNPLFQLASVADTHPEQCNPLMPSMSRLRWSTDQSHSQSFAKVYLDSNFENNSFRMADSTMEMQYP